MPVLQYDIAVVGVQQVERALASIERRFMQSNRRMVGEVQRMSHVPAVRSAARMSSGQVKKEADGLARSFAQIGAAAKRQQEEVKRLARENRGLADSFKSISKAAQQAERDQIRGSRRAQQEFRRRTGRVVGRVVESLQGIGSTALAVTGLGGGALIASRLGGAAALERRQRQVIVNARGAGQANPIEYSDLQKRIANTSIATGASQEDVTAGLEKFVQRTGDLTGAVDLMNSLATASVATGSSMEDLAGVAADLQQKFDIKKPEEMADALAVLAMQGKKGAFELRDMANTFPELAAAAQRVGMAGVGGMRTLGGLAQIARSATGSGEEASTALQMALTQIGAKGAEIQAGKFSQGRKINVFSDKGMTQFRDVKTVLADVIAGTRGSIPALTKIFEVRGGRALNPLVSKFTTAQSAALAGGASETKAAEAGRAAILAAIDDAANASGTFADMQRDAADVQKSANVQLEKLNTELTSSVQKDLLPALVRLIPAFQKLIPTIEGGVEKLAEFVAWFAENPYKGLGAIVLGKVTADLAMAGIGAGVKSVLMSIIESMRGGGGGVPAPGGAGGGSLVPAFATAGLVGFSTGAAIGESTASKFNNPMLAAVETKTALAEGTLSDRGAMVQRRAELQTARSGLAGGPSTGDKILYGISQLFGGPSAAEANRKAMTELNGAIDKLNQALDANTKATNGTALNRGNTPSPVKG